MLRNIEGCKRLPAAINVDRNNGHLPNSLDEGALVLVPGRRLDRLFVNSQHRLQGH